MTQNVGGIVGDSSQAEVQDCTISGSVEAAATGSGSINAGGIAGSALSVDRAVSKVTRVSGETSGTGGVSVGGVTGSGSPTNSILVPRSGGALIEAKSTVEAQGYMRQICAGGISGYAPSRSITNSGVTGPATIRAESAGKQDTLAGGIAGTSAVANSYTLQGVKVEALAKNTETLGQYEQGAIAAGGIAGQLPNGYGAIANCFSNSEVRVENSLNTTGSSYASVTAGGLIGNLGSGSIENSYAAGTVELKNNHAECVVFAGGLAGLGDYSSALSVKNSAALNNSVRVETANAGENAAHVYRILGGASSYMGGLIPVDRVPEHDKIILIQNYASPDLEPQQKTGSEGAWQAVNQGANDTYGLMGDGNLEPTEAFFSGTLGWNFGGQGPAAVWKWDDALKLPVLNTVN
jgi:hypothetical protein